MQLRMKPAVLGMVFGVSAAASGVVFAQADALKTAAQKALANPEVAARLEALRAATQAVDVARGAYLPRVDASADIGRTEDSFRNRSPQTQALTQRGLALSASQTIWDGLATFNDVRRAGHERLLRGYELRDTAEQTALEAVRASYDVARYRRLVALAEDSYVAHRAVFTQIDSRFRAGVGRGVDLEQANARLALAESNRLTELANLHDVTQRYQRVVGELPPAALALPAPLAQGVPGSAAQAATQAVQRNAAIGAAVENLRAQRALVALREAALQPKLEARLRGAVGRNLDGLAEQRRDSSADLLLSWNLYNGGADTARVRQQADLLNQAAQLRDRACREVRQSALIAFNDTRKLAEQLPLLDRNAIAIEKARDAYRQQFDIGQRSLLDLLNAENELYTARRAYANAEHELGIAYARSHAAQQQLLPRLGLSPIDTGLELAETPGSGDDAPRCPSEVGEVAGSDRGALDARAAQQVRTAPATPPVTPAPPPVPPAPRR